MASEPAVFALANGTPRQPFDRWRKGDLVRVGRIRRRVVRIVKWHGYLRYVMFAKLRQSWTRSPYTILTRSDIKTRLKEVRNAE